MRWFLLSAIGGVLCANLSAGTITGEQSLPAVSYEILPDLKFKAVYYPPVPGSFYSQNFLSYGDFSLAGPNLQSLVPLPAEITHVARDPSQETYYTLQSNTVVSHSSGAAEEIPFPDVIRGSSNLMGITFDEQRNRLLVGSGRRGGDLFQFDLATEQWTVLSQMYEDYHEKSNNAMAYDSKDDLLYVLSLNRSHHSDFLVYNAAGSLIESIDLGLPPLSEIGLQLLSVDDYLVLLTRPFLNTPALSLPGQTYLITPETGSAVQVVPEPSTAMLAIVGIGMIAGFRFHYQHRLICVAAVVMATSGNNEAAAQQRELHAVAVSSNINDQVSIQVDRPGKQVTLFLSAYNSLAWDVSATPGTEIETVIFSGRGNQSSLGLSEGINILRYDGVPSRKIRIDLDRGLNTKDSQDGIRRLHELTGLHIASFQRDPSQENESTITVNDLQNDPALQLTFPKPVPYAALPDLRFEAIYYPPNPPGGDIPYTPMYGEFSLAGPNLDSLAPIPAGITHVTKDKSRGVYYGAKWEEFFVIDFLAGTAEEVTIPELAEDTSHPAGITYDERRDRLIFANEIAHHDMYQIDMASDQWSILSDFPEISHTAIAYHSGNDLLYSIAHNARMLTELYVLNSHGAVIEIMDLGIPMWIFPHGRNGQGLTTYPQLLSVDDYLVLITPEAPDTPSKTYLISLDTGSVVQVVPEPSAALLMITGLGMVAWYRYRRQR